MRFVQALDHSTHADAPAEDAAASMFLFAIVGGLVLAVAAPTIPAVALGAMLGACVGIIVAYH